ncbi:Sec23p [Saccharomyces cerevisiae x Saccharomyces kudriavzevii VIN7]|uniref:Sec23p n=1 Tax=Saccharomyces cerevisiae x Saccharomyces kudriavzevii (strain VIN7) TaxID=1095631 RepID=H0H2M6_SACCK|nr:Sec23p [Saccharomyces cerevisiae x Saccharomyces kudriavzevii VIN7]
MFSCDRLVYCGGKWFLELQMGQLQDELRGSITQYGFRIDLQCGPEHTTGLYGATFNSSYSFKGVYKQPTGTTLLLASLLVEGNTFQVKRTPLMSSLVSKSMARKEGEGGKRLNR